MASILLIDDDPALRRTIVRILATGGHQVFDVGNGRVGLQALSLCKPAIVITDIFMPDKDGIETVREIRAQYPSIKILAMSGGGRAGRFDFLTIAKSFGADYILEKPFRPQALLDAVEGLILGYDKPRIPSGG